METHGRTRSREMQSTFPAEPIRVHQIPTDQSQDNEKSDSTNVSFMKGPKRKRLAKACDACHKSKRRCDGTAPCSNCYFASKNCTYTDASGRPVPAPRPNKQDQPETAPLDTRPLQTNPEPWAPPIPPPSNSYNPYVPEPSTSGTAPDQDVDDEHGSSRKRFRTELGGAVPPPEHIQRNLVPNPRTNVGDRPSNLDPALTRELVNLFFTHCHPQRMIIHKATFSVALSQNHVPPYLLNAICSLSAPFSKQPRIRTSPPRFAGRPFAQEAITMMFDSAGRLACEPNLATAQTLCLLQMQDIKTGQPPWNLRFHELALQILNGLDVHKQNNPLLTPIPSPEYMMTSIEQECIRRVFWLVYLMDLISSIWHKRTTSFKESDLKLRLPVDETSFEFAVHSTVPEYLFHAAPRVHWASEFGHLIRIYSIYAKVESALDTAIVPDSGPPVDTFIEFETALEGWASSLPDHLRFSAENLQVQLSMFETSSNVTAWCFSLIHITHAACAMALNAAKQLYQKGVANGPEWAIDRLPTVVNSLGGRAKYSPILAASIWPLVKYCKRDDPQILAWSAQNEEIWGKRVEDYVPVEWRGQHQLRASAPVGTPPGQNDETASNASGSGSTYPSLGRSLNELRLHRPLETRSPVGGESRQNEKESRRLISDADIDPALQGTPSSRPHAENSMSLPSLKASGLLDSWNTSGEGMGSAGSSARIASATSHSRSDPPQRGSLPRRSPPGTASSSTAYRPESDPARSSSSSGMPVGLPWLANESSVPKPA